MAYQFENSVFSGTTNLVKKVTSGKKIQKCLNQLQQMFAQLQVRIDCFNAYQKNKIVTNFVLRKKKCDCVNFPFTKKYIFTF